MPTVGPHSFEVARKYVDKVVTVSEKYLALAVLRCLEHEKAVVEGGGAAGLAALLPVSDSPFSLSTTAPLRARLLNRFGCYTVCLASTSRLFRR